MATHEHNGLIFAYLGPPEEQPSFPVFDAELVPGASYKTFSITTPCNWLQVYENTQDPIHVLHLHARSSGVQFGVASGVDQVIEFLKSPLGMFNVQTRHIGSNVWTRITETILPNGNQTGAIWEEAEEEKYFQRSSILRWMVPVDNTTTLTIGWRFFSERLDPRGQDQPKLVGKESIDFIGQTADERSYEEAQRQPGDYEAQVSQRAIAIHDLEHRATSDRGVVMLRRLLRERIRALQNGEPAEHPSFKGLNAISTYCQDTVCRWRGDAAPDDEALRLQGQRVVAAILETDTMAPSAREAEIRRRCEFSAK